MHPPGGRSRPTPCAVLASIWQLHVDRRPKNAPDTVWAGVEPAALFRSDDRGDTFELVRGLWDHPDRELGTGLRRPGASHGGHAPRATGPDHRCGFRRRVYRSDDGGADRAARERWGSRRVSCPTLSRARPGVHKLAVDAVNPDVLWAQNHWRHLPRTEDAGDHWVSVGRPGEPGRASRPTSASRSYLAPEGRPDTALRRPPPVRHLPLAPHTGAGRVYRTMDAGITWEAMGRACPRPQRQHDVLRDAFESEREPALPARVRCQSGHIFVLVDGAESWRLWSPPTCRLIPLPARSRGDSPPSVTPAARTGEFEHIPGS